MTYYISYGAENARSTEPREDAASALDLIIDLTRRGQVDIKIVDENKQPVSRAVLLREAYPLSNIAALSNPTIQEHHKAIAALLAAEDAGRSTEHNVRENADFRYYSDAFEELMRDRNLAYRPTDWTR